MKRPAAFIDRLVLFLFCAFALFTAIPALAVDITYPPGFGQLMSNPVQQGSPANKPARLELYGSQWVPATINHISATAGFTGADPGAQMNAALSSSLCTNGCIVDDGEATGSASSYITFTTPVVIGANQHVILHAHWAYFGVMPSTGLFIINGPGASVVCEQQPMVQTRLTPSSWQGTCGIDAQPTSGSGPVVMVGEEFEVVHNLTIRGNQFVTSLIAAIDGIELVGLQVTNNVLRGNFSGGTQTTSWAIDLNFTTNGIVDGATITDNMVYWTTGFLRINPQLSGGGVVIARNKYYLGYGPMLQLGPGYTFATHIESNWCTFSLGSTANEIIWDFNNSDNFAAITNHSECYDPSSAGGVIQARVTNGTAGLVHSNDFNGNQTDSVVAHDAAYGLYLVSTKNVSIVGNLLKGSHIAGIHHGASVSGITEQSNFFVKGHGAAGVLADGAVLPIYGADAMAVGPGTGSPTGWADACQGCGGVGITANKYNLVGKFIPYPVSFSQMCATINVADGANNSDLCLYDQNGNLVANVGGTHMASPGTQCFNITQAAPAILPPGLYFIGWTSVAATINIMGAAGGSQLAYSLSLNYGASASGTCGATITPPSKSPTPGALELGLF